jgi:hypothetical protein
VEAPTEIGGRRVVLFGELAEPIENLPGEPLTVAVAIVADGDATDFLEALELDAKGRFIAPYEWAILSLDGFERENPYGVKRWINPRL